jgi:hypothetical protein
MAVRDAARLMLLAGYRVALEQRLFDFSFFKETLLVTQSRLSFNFVFGR